MAFWPFKDNAFYNRLFRAAERSTDEPKTAVEVRTEAFDTMRDYLPARYRFGHLPGAILAMARARLGLRADRKAEAEPAPEELAEAARVRLRDTQRQMERETEQAPGCSTSPTRMHAAYTRPTRVLARAGLRSVADESVRARGRAAKRS